MTRRSRPVLLGLVIAVCLALLAPVAYADPSAAPSTPGTPATPAAPVGSLAANPLLSGVTPTLDPTLDKARHALARVQHLLDRNQQPASPAPSRAEAADVTMALRNLARTYRALPRRQRATAERILARPDGTGMGGCSYDYACYRRGAPRHVTCAGGVCVHWVARTQDGTNGVPAEDNGPGGTYNVPMTEALNGVPDMVDFTLRQMTYIRRSYIRAGYRTPRGDGGVGGSNAIDIYLADVGGSRVYGYCTSDDPRLANDPAGRKHIAASAYCVLDNDFSPSQFGTRHTPAQNLEVTAAHEYFHAVQFAYDYDEDAWMMEATAVWAEDELYDGINDNRGYLRSGPMHRPQNPVDLYSGLNEYGAWAFFRYLTDHFRAARGGMPVLVLRVWTHAASTGPGARGQYSLQAIRSVLHNSFHTDLPHQFTRFALANRFPGQSYSEGSHYPRATLLLNRTLAPGHLGGGADVTLKHLSARHLRFRPGKGVGGGARLRIAVTGPTKGAGQAVAVRVKPVDGAMHRVRFRINRAGDGTHRIAFGRGRIAWVEITVLNVSSAYRCNLYGASSEFWAHTCQGKPRHNSNKVSVAVRALR